MNNTTSTIPPNITEIIRKLTQENKNNNEAGDATWILTSAFIIFTMQSGFGLLEAGSCSGKNECNIMIKNAVDVIYGALGYYVCGFAFSFGEDERYSNAFTGFGNFFVHSDSEEEHATGHLYARYFFQLSFATTATTIVSGAMAERTNLKAYMLFSFLNFFSYVYPAHWIWDDSGFLKKLDVVDIAGCGPVHVVGGMSALVATIMLRPRLGIFDKNKPSRDMASPTNVVLGTFMLWWGWLGFNCGSTFGVSGGKWKLASKAAVVTVNGSVGGGLWSIFYSYALTKRYNRKLDVGVFTNGILAGLVSITAICAICQPWEALVIGWIGGMICSYGAIALIYLKIDDPVTCIPVHLLCGVWGLLAVGLFGEKELVENSSNLDGIFKGGGPKFLGYQVLAALSLMGWSGATTAIELFIADVIFGLRMSKEKELKGADFTEHGISTTGDAPEAPHAFGKRSITRTTSKGLSKRHKKRSLNERDIHLETIDENFDEINESVNNFRNKGIMNFGIVSINETLVTGSVSKADLKSSPYDLNSIDSIQTCNYDDIDNTFNDTDKTFEYHTDDVQIGKVNFI